MARGSALSHESLTTESDTDRLLYINSELEKLEARWAPAVQIRTGAVAIVVGFVAFRIWQIAASTGAGLEMGLILGLGLSLPVSVRIWEWRRIKEFREEASSLEKRLDSLGSGQIPS